MEIQLITEDFKGSDYQNSLNCPLYKALKRLGHDCVRVGFVTASTIFSVFEIPNHWDPFLVGELIEKANSGEEVTYEIELTEL